MSARMNEVGALKSTACECRLFRVNKHEWWAATSLNEAIDAAAAHYGVEPHEVTDDLYRPYMIAEAKAWETWIQHEGTRVPLQLLLKVHMQSGGAIPAQLILVS